MMVVLAACSSSKQVAQFKEHDSRNALVLIRIGSEVKTHDFGATIEADGTGLDVIWSRYEPPSPKSTFLSGTAQAGEFIAYSLPPGRYRIKEAELFLGHIPVPTGFTARGNATTSTLLEKKVTLTRDGPDQIVFDVGPGEAVYVGDIVYEIRAKRDAYRIDIRDRFREAKWFFTARFKDASLPLKRRLARNARFEDR